MMSLSHGICVFEIIALIRGRMILSYCFYECIDLMYDVVYRFVILNFYRENNFFTLINDSLSPGPFSTIHNLHIKLDKDITLTWNLKWHAHI